MTLDHLSELKPATFVRLANHLHGTGLTGRPHPAYVGKVYYAAYLTSHSRH